MAEEDFDDLEQPVLPEEPGGQEQPPPGPTLSDRVQDAQGRVEQAGDYRDKFNDWRAARAQKRAAKQGLRGVEQKGAEAARRKVATRVEGEAAKQAAKKVAVQAGAKVGTTLAAEAAAGPVGWVAGAITVLTSLKSFLLPAVKKLWPYVVYIIAVLLILPAIIFALLAKPPITPGNATQLFQAQAILPFIGGDFVVSGGKITQKVLEAETKRYAIIQKNIDADSRVSGRSAEVKTKIGEILKLIESGIGVSGEPKKKLTALALTKIRELDSTLPFGEWIAKAAEGQVGQPSGNFCRFTGASGNVACASFVTTVLQNAGIPTPLEPLVDDVWENPALRLVVDHQTTDTAGYFQQNVSKLQRGDIIFWGSGSGKEGRSKNFNHIGFYVGNGKAIDNSSGNVAKGIQPHIKPPTQAAKRGRNGLFFNGAKRYGANL